MLKSKFIIYKFDVSGNSEKKQKFFRNFKFLAFWKNNLINFLTFSRIFDFSLRK